MSLSKDTVLKKTIPEWMESCSDFIGFLDCDASIIDINKTVGPPKETVLSRPFLDFVLPEHHEKVTACFDLVLSKKEKQSIIYSIVHEGIEKQLSVSFFPVFDQHSDEIEMIQFVASEPRIIEIQKDEQKLDKLYSQLKEDISVLELIEKHSRDFIAIYTPEGIFQYISSSVEDLLGYTPKNLLGKSCYDFKHPEDFPHVEKAQKKLLEGKSIVVEYRMRHAQGHYIWVESTISNTKDASDFVVKLMSITRKIEKRKNVEFALAESERQLKRAQSVAKIGGWEWNVKTNSTWFSPEAYAVYGLEPSLDLFSKMDTRDLIYPEDRTGVLNEFENALKEKRDLKIEHRVVNPVTKNVLYLICFAKLLLDDSGNADRFVGYIQDMTERKMAEIALQKSEKSLNRAQSIAQMGSWEWDIRSNEVTWSDSLYRIYGVDKNVFKPSYEGVLSLIHADDSSFFTEYLKVALEKNLDVDFEHRVIRPLDNDVLYIHCLGDIVLDTDGNPIKMHGTSQDITEQRTLKENLKNTLDELKQSLDKKDVLLQEVHHRVKNNLQIMSSLFNLKYNDLGESAELKSLCQSFQARIHAMSLLHGALYEGDDAEMINFSIYLNNLSEYLSKAYHLREKKILLDTTVDSSISFKMDLVHNLGLIINEGITNAIQHAFHAKEGRVTIALSGNKKEYCLRISDTGVGISEEKLNSPKTGLGLRLMHLLVKQIKGSFKISNGKGTTIEILFSV